MSVWSEISSSPEITRTGRNHWEGLRRFAVNDDAAVALENTLWNSPMGHSSGDCDPRCRWIRSMPSGLPGVTLTIARFKTVRQPGVARVRGGDIHILTERVTKDLDGKYVDGFDFEAYQEDPTKLFWYRAVEGSPTRLRARARFTIETAYEGSFPLGTLMEAVGSVNESSLSNLGLSEQRVLVLGAPFSAVWQEDDLWYVDVGCLYEPRGWNALVRCQKHSRLAVEIPVADIEGNIGSARLREMLMMLPVEKDAEDEWVETEKEPRRNFDTTDYLDVLDGMIA